MTSEREMLIGDGARPDRSLGIRMKKRKRRVGFRRAALGFVTLLVLTAGAAWYFGPRVASSVVEGEYPVPTQGGTARLVLEDVRLDWGGPQQLGRVRLEDASGTVLADISVETTASLLGAYRARDLGVITVSGTIDITEAQILAFRPPSAPRAADRPAPPLGSSPRPPALPQIRLPQRWRGTIQTSNLALTYEGGSADFPLAKPVEIQGLDLRASYDGHSSANLELSATSPPLQIELDARSLADARGMLDLERAEADAQLSARLPGWLVDSLIRLALDEQPPETTSPDLADEQATIEAGFTLADGRLTLDDQSSGARATLPLPIAIASRLEDGAGSIEWIERPEATLRIDRLDVPLAASDGSTWSSGALEMSIETGAGELFGTFDSALEPDRIMISPASLRVRSDDLSSGLEIDGQTQLAFGSRQPASLELTASSGPLLDERGALVREIPAGIQATLALARVPMALLEPFAARADLILEPWLGDQTQAHVSLRTWHDESREGALVVSVEAEGSSPTSDWQLLADVTGQEIVMTGSEAARFSARNIAPLVQHLVRNEENLHIGGEGRFGLALADVHIPLVGGVPDLRAARAAASVSVGNLSLEIDGVDDSIALDDLRTDLALQGGEPARAQLDWQARYGPDQARIVGDLHARDLIVPKDRGDWPWLAFGADAARVHGTMRVDGAPTRIVDLVAPDWSDLILHTIGPALGIEMDLAPSDDALAAARIRAIGTEGFTLNSMLQINDPATVDVGPVTVEAPVATETLAAIDRAAGTEALEGITLQEETSLRLDVEPFQLTSASAEGQSHWVSTPISSTISTSSDLVVHAPARNPTETDLTIVSRDPRIESRLTIDNGVRGSASVATELFDRRGGEDWPLGVLSATARNQGGVRWQVGQARIEIADTSAVDRLASAGGMLSELLGSNAAIEIAPGEDAGFDLVDLTLEAERMTASGRMKLDSDRVSLASPLIARATLSQPLIERLLALDTGAERSRIAEATELNLAVSTLALGAGTRPLFDPEIFTVDLIASVSQLAILTRSGQRIGLSSPSLKIASAQAPGALDLQLTAGALQSPAGTAESPSADIHVENAFDAQGSLTPRSMRLTGAVSGGAPTDLLDGLAGARGLLVDLLGHMTTIDLQMDDLSRTSGHVVAVARTDYADMRVEGEPRDGALHCTQQAVATLHRITPELSARALERIMPMVEGVEKTPDDRPAVIQGDGLHLPIDGDLRKLSGKLRIDLGTVRFSTSGFVSTLLEATQNQAAGTLGRQIEPFDVVIVQGVASYDDTMIPIGEFDVMTRGSIDLAQDRMELILFIPLFALADEIAAGLGGTSGLDRDTPIPFRVIGPTADPEVKLAADLMPEVLVPGLLDRGAKEVGDEVGGEAGKAIEDLLRGIGRGLGGKDKKKDDGG